MKPGGRRRDELPSNLWVGGKEKPKEAKAAKLRVREPGAEK